MRLFAANAESVSDARARAIRIHHLLACIADTPDQVAWLKEEVSWLRYFIRKGRRGTLDMNDLDGMARRYGNTAEYAELTERDRQQMRDDKKAWRRMPKGWPGWTYGSSRQMYCSKLHAKEIAVLDEMQTECENEIFHWKNQLPEWERELEDLRQIGFLPPAVAARLNMTIDGKRLAA